MQLVCDRDNVAQAYVVVVDGTRAKELHLCGHHYNEHEWALISQGWTVRLDTREELIRA